MSREDPQFKLRMPIGMKEQLSERALKNGRSLNSEIISLINIGLYRELYDSEVTDGNLGYEGDDEYQQKILLAKDYLIQAINMLKENPIKEKPQPNKKPT